MSGCLALFLCIANCLGLLVGFICPIEDALALRSNPAGACEHQANTGVAGKRLLSQFRLVSCSVSKLAHESVKLFHLLPASPPPLPQSGLSALIALEPSGELIHQKGSSAPCFSSTVFEDSWRVLFPFQQRSSTAPLLFFIFFLSS